MFNLLLERTEYISSIIINEMFVYAGYSQPQSRLTAQTEKYIYTYNLKYV